MLEWCSWNSEASALISSPFVEQFCPQLLASHSSLSQFMSTHQEILLPLPSKYTSTLTTYLLHHYHPKLADLVCLNAVPLNWSPLHHLWLLVICSVHTVARVILLKCKSHHCTLLFKTLLWLPTPLLEKHLGWSVLLMSYTYYVTFLASFPLFLLWLCLLQLHWLLSRTLEVTDPSA